MKTSDFVDENIYIIEEVISASDFVDGNVYTVEEVI